MLWIPLPDSWAVATIHLASCMDNNIIMSSLDGLWQDSIRMKFDMLLFSKCFIMLPLCRKIWSTVSTVNLVVTEWLSAHLPAHRDGEGGGKRWKRGPCWCLIPHLTPSLSTAPHQLCKILNLYWVLSLNWWCNSKTKDNTVLTALFYTHRAELRSFSARSQEPPLHWRMDRIVEICHTGVKIRYEGPCLTRFTDNWPSTQKYAAAMQSQSMKTLQLW